MAATARLVLLLVISVMVMTGVLALPRFPDELPSLPVVNGVQVRGVGHVNPQGRGALNSFGQVSPTLRACIRSMQPFQRL